MNVYLLTWYPYLSASDGAETVGIFSTRELADAAALADGRGYAACYEVEEIEIDAGAQHD